MISATDVTKKFGSTLALERVSFTISPGEFVFLTGPSGSGKTTLLRLIMRESRPDAGILLVDGQDVAKLPQKKLPLFRRNLGVVFQDFKLLADRNVLENVALPLEVRRIKATDVQAAVAKALVMVELDKKGNLFPAQLSGGELQRVALARAIVGKPKVILADEPTGNLDPATARHIVKLLKEIHQELKTTVLMATHNADIVNHFHQRVISLDKGRVVKDSPQGKYD